MSRIFYLMGKSASGKDSIYQELMKYFSFEKIIMYTTRPMRQGEKDGVQYWFTDAEQFQALEAAGKVIESRCYETVHGPWIYYTVDDGTMNQENRKDYLMIGTLESYARMLEYYGDSVMVPLYLEVADGLRLQRAVDREKQQDRPNFSEVCRRYLADEEDFSEEKLLQAGITRRFANEKLEDCLKELIKFIEGGTA